MKELKTDDFELEVLNSPLPVLVDFYASWCGPCRSQTPILEQFAVEMQGKLSVVKVNVDDEPGLAKEYGVMSIPTLVLFKNGQAVNKVVGLQSAQNLRELTK